MKLKIFLIFGCLAVLTVLLISCSQKTSCEKCRREKPDCFSCCDHICDNAGVDKQKCDSTVDLATCAYTEKCGCVNLNFVDKCGGSEDAAGINCECVDDRCVEK